MNNTIKEQVRILWDKCFTEEDKRFVDFYFEKRYNEDDNIFIERDNKVVSALQLISYPFSYYGKTIGCAMKFDKLQKRKHGREWQLCILYRYFFIF